MKQLATTFSRLLRRFFCARGGNITIIFAVMAIPVIGFAGAAVD
jgi:Flp pilus assembly protein TadG